MGIDLDVSVIELVLWLVQFLLKVGVSFCKSGELFVAHPQTYGFQSDSRMSCGIYQSLLVVLLMSLLATGIMVFSWLPVELLPYTLCTLSLPSSLGILILRNKKLLS